MAVRALDVINRGLRVIGAIGAGQPLEAEDAGDGFALLNDMLDSMSADGILIYEIREEVFSLPAGQSTRTIGPGGQWDTDTPTRIEWAFARLASFDYRIDVLTSEQWASQSAKLFNGGWPTYVYLQGSEPLAVLHFLNPASSTVEIHLGTWRQFPAFTSLTDTEELPPGYKEFLIYNFAVRAAPEYGVTVSPEIAGLANSSRARIARNNHESMTATCEVCGLTYSGGSSSILTG